MRKLLIGIIAVLVLFSCGQSYEETKRQSRAHRLKLQREDSAALKIAVMPTLDCLPIFVAKDHEMFDTAVDIRLKYFTAHTAQMDCDTAIMNRRVEIGITDVVRAERMMKAGTPVRYFAGTNAYWVLVSNRQQRISQLKHLDDKMVAMTRYSVTDMLGDMAVDSAKLEPWKVFRIQVNDVNIRLKMLENNEMDALVFTEPQYTQAMLRKPRVLLDTRTLDLKMGAIVVQSKGMDDKTRKKQMSAFLRGYNEACDSINQFGVQHYKDVIRKRYKVSEQALKQLPNLKYSHAVAPREKDIEAARQWLSKK